MGVFGIILFHINVLDPNSLKKYFYIMNHNQFMELFDYLAKFLKLQLE